jgi:hypothetical protein
MTGKSGKKTEKLECAGGSSRSCTDTGRIQNFVHYPGSELPVRDFRTRTEPHIEVGAAGYVRPEMQRAIRSFCRSNERYLFLAAKCRNRVAGNGRFFGKRFVAGYIARLMCLRPHGHWAVFGPIRIVPFDPRLEFGRLGIRAGRGIVHLDRPSTRELRKLINRLPDIRARCVREMKALEEAEKKNGVRVIADRACLDKKGKCEFKARCLRKKPGSRAGCRRPGF